MHSNFGPDPVISVWEHTGVRATGPDHKRIWVWTSSWAVLNQEVSKHYSLLIQSVFKSQFDLESDSDSASDTLNYSYSDSE